MRASILIVALLAAVAFAAPFADVAVRGKVTSNEPRVNSLKGYISLSSCPLQRF